MRKYWIAAVLFAVFVSVVQSYLALSVPGFSDDAAYVRLRNAQHILETGLPITQDSLVPRRSVVVSLFDYVLAGVALFLPLETAGKVVPNVLAGVLAIAFFWLALRVGRNPQAALLATIVLVTLPEVVGLFNSISPLVLVLIGACVLHVCLANGGRGWWGLMFVATLGLLAVTHPSVIVLVLGVGVTILLKLSERVLEREELELGLFSVFFVMTASVVAYRKLLREFGIALLSASVPEQVAATLFPPLSILDAITSIGIVTIGVALTTVYQTLFYEKKTRLHYAIGLLAAASVLLWGGFVPARLGMLFFVLPAVLLFGAGYARFTRYVRQTRIAQHAWIIHTCLILFLLSTNVLQSAVSVQNALRRAPSRGELDVASWIRDVTDANVTVVSPPVRGEFLAYATGRKVVLDTFYSLTPDAQVRFTDVSGMFTTPFEIEAVALMERYGAGVMYVPSFVPLPRYVPGRCFSVAYASDATVVAKSPLCKVVL
ncbi:glycosyltransferase family 39 protein [Candidatus Woesearchaeota archaeon]|nr:glycosyltransferase family 39 protein [Candidatus Woesearchaeota archaeon]